MDQEKIKKIVLLNQATLNSMMEKDNRAIIKNFTEAGISIMEADFGFAWWKLHDNEPYRLAYKSASTPYEPTIPRENAGNYVARMTKRPFFDSQIKKENYLFDIYRYLKSYIIIPIYYKEIVYGSLVLCYKKKHAFTEDEVDIAIIVGTTTAQAITIHRLVANEQKVRLESERQEAHFRAFADATHELRTPLAIIKGNLELALQGRAKRSLELTRMFKIINSEMKHFSHILSDLSTVTSKGMELKNILVNEPVPLKTLMNEVVRRSKSLAHKKHISIRVASIPNLTIQGDKAYLEKMFINLVKNSIMYGNKNGHTKISVEKSKKSLRIYVSDDGIGIAKEDLPHVFDRFYKADKSHTASGTSTGLGLAIVKWVAEAHGGTVSVKSIKNKGTTFSVLLPIKNFR